MQKNQSVTIRTTWNLDLRLESILNWINGPWKVKFILVKTFKFQKTNEYEPVTKFMLKNIC